MQRINTLLTDYSGKSQTKKEDIKAEPYIYICITHPDLPLAPHNLCRSQPFLSVLSFLCRSGNMLASVLTHSDDNARARTETTTSVSSGV